MPAITVNERPVMEFWPQDAGPKIQAVFANKTARILWLGIKGNHIVSTDFNDACISMGIVIDRAKADGREITASWLTYLMQDYRAIGSAEKYGDQLLPYVLEERPILWRHTDIDLDDWVEYADGHRDKEAFQSGKA